MSRAGPLPAPLTAGAADDEAAGAAVAATTGAAAATPADAVEATPADAVEATPAGLVDVGVAHAPSAALVVTLAAATRPGPRHREKEGRTRAPRDLMTRELNRKIARSGHQTTELHPPLLLSSVSSCSLRGGRGSCS